ncbi:MAG TPA: hypothetical protein VMT47_19045 [Polyangia bacterium]|nr:hypothetical protein [Polyangia bacterium]
MTERSATASQCTAKDFSDPTKCSPCTQVTHCMNTCDRCELCVGKTSVPEDCTAGDTTGPDGSPPSDAGGTPTCTGGFSCVPGPNAVCPTGYGCLTGGCVPSSRNEEPRRRAP